MNRDHSAPHGGEARYLRDASRLSLPLRFDRCGVEREQMGGIHYRPSGRRLVGQLAELTARELQLEEHTVSRPEVRALVKEQAVGLALGGAARCIALDLHRQLVAEHLHALPTTA